MVETRESVILDITLLTGFANVQQFKIVNNLAFLQCRIDTDLSIFNLLWNLSLPTLSFGLFDFYFDPKTLKKKQRCVEILDIFVTIFADFGNFVVVRVIRNWEKRVI